MADAGPEGTPGSSTSIDFLCYLCYNLADELGQGTSGSSRCNEHRDPACLDARQASRREGDALALWWREGRSGAYESSVDTGPQDEKPNQPSRY